MWAMKAERIAQENHQGFCLCAYRCPVLELNEFQLAFDHLRWSIMFFYVNYCMNSKKYL